MPSETWGKISHSSPSQVSANKMPTQVVWEELLNIIPHPSHLPWITELLHGISPPSLRFSSCSWVWSSSSWDFLSTELIYTHTHTHTALFVTLDVLSEPSVWTRLQQGGKELSSMPLSSLRLLAATQMPAVPEDWKSKVREQKNFPALFLFPFQPISYFSASAAVRLQVIRLLEREVVRKKCAWGEVASRFEICRCCIFYLLQQCCIHCCYFTDRCKDPFGCWKYPASVSVMLQSSFFCLVTRADFSTYVFFLLTWGTFMLVLMPNCPMRLELPKTITQEMSFSTTF